MRATPRAAERIAATRINPKLPGIRVDDNVVLTSVIARAAEADAILLAAPTQELRAAATALAPHVRDAHPCHRLRKRHRARHAEIRDRDHQRGGAARHAGHSLGPGLCPGHRPRPADGGDDRRARCAGGRGSWRIALGTPTFRPYHSTDIRGVEIGGAAKNVLAIAAGIVVGRKLGASAQAALTTRGFAELVRFGEAFGARGETLAGLSGLGDLILSCSSPQSRNLSFGIALGEGKSVDTASGGKLVEGAFTAQVLREMARSKSVDMPITEAVAAVLDGQLSVQDAIDMLLTRPFKAEA